MKQRITVFFLFAVTLLPALASAQVSLPSAPPDPAPLFRMVDQAYMNGDISLDEQILQKFYIVVDPEKVMDRFKPLPNELPLRCLTPLLIEYSEISESLSSATRNEIEAYSNHLCDPPSMDETFVSASGRFVIHYDRIGPDAVPPTDVSGFSNVPDFVEKAAFAADSSWAHQVNTIGFTDPLLPLNPYHIYIQEIASYGFTCTDPFSLSTFIVIDNDFIEFPSNSHPEGKEIGALYATVAHEFKHAVQYAANSWAKAPSETRSERDAWLEMDATLMEEVVFDDSNDYYNYIKTGLQSFTPRDNSLFGTPQTAIPTGEYAHMTWMLYFSEVFGIEFWVDVWDRVQQMQQMPFLLAIQQTLNERGETFGTQHTENFLWHLATGPGSAIGGFGFDERENYPVPRYVQEWISVPDSMLGTRNLPPLTADFHRVVPPFNIQGQVQVIATHNQQTLGIALVARFRNGTMARNVYTGGFNKTQIRTVWEWSEISELQIAAVNFSEISGTSYRLILENPLPQQIVLENNYPNPFQSQTRIDFAIDRPLNVRLDVIDIAGRRIRTLTDREYEPGFHYVDFIPLDLASGLYFYRIIAGDEQAVKSMIYFRN